MSFDMNSNKASALLGLLVILCLNLVGAQRARDCTCTSKFHVASSQVLPTKNLPTGDGTDTFRDECDFDCTDYCAREVRKDLGNLPDTIPLIGYEEMCERAYPDRTLPKDGIVVTANWDLRDCDLDDAPKAYVVSSNTCCRFCKCSYGIKTALTSQMQLLDFSPQVFRSRPFECDQLDSNKECEMDCRRELAAHLRFTEVNKIDQDKYEILNFPQVANQFCEDYGRSIYSPGVELYGFIETGPKDQSWHKEISMGKLCCKRQCKCQLFYRVWNEKNETMISDLTPALKQRPPSYECGLELSDCLEDCRLEAGLLIKNPEFTDVNKSPLDVSPLEVFQTARKICMLIQKNTRAEGIRVYLRYQTAESDVYPRAQDLLLGHLCCSKYLGVDYFPFNNCKPWDVSVPIDLNDSH